MRHHLMMHLHVYSVHHVPCALLAMVLQMVRPGPDSESRPRPAGTVSLHGQVIPFRSTGPSAGTDAYRMKTSFEKSKLPDNIRDLLGRIR